LDSVSNHTHPILMTKPQNFAYVTCLIVLLVVSFEKNPSTFSAPNEGGGNQADRIVGKDSKKTGVGSSTSDDLSSDTASSEDRLRELKSAIHGFTAETNLAARDYERYNGRLLELAERFPDEACRLLASGSIERAYKSKVSMFSAMLANPDKMKTIPLLEELEKARNTNPDGRETAAALSEALGKVRNDPAFAGVIKSLFVGEDAGTNISYYFKEAGKLRGVGLADNLSALGLSGRDQDAAVFAIALSVAGQDQHAALDLLDRLDAGFAGSAYGEIMLQLLDRDPASAKQMLLDLDDVKLRGAIKHPYLLQALVKSENIGLLENVLQRFVITKDSASTFETLINGMAALDRPQAARILDQLPESSSRSALIQDLWRGTNVTTLEEAVSAMSNLPEASTVDGTRGILKSLAASDQEAAFQLIGKSPRSMQSRLVADVIDQSVASSPANAASVFNKEIKSGRLEPSDASEVAWRISFASANHNIEQARKWTRNLPSAYQPGAYKGLMESWGKSDPVGASEWLATIPAGPGRDAGARALVSEIESTDAQMAAKWKETYER
jgi:hypothetical protein